MKRSAALAPLSRDHQHGLDAALRLRRADARTIGDAVAHFQAFFEREGRAHFEIEERHLLGALPADDADWRAAVARVRDDHRAIRAAAGGGELPVEAARTLGERLSAHIRFEERVVFELLEARLTPDALERLGAAVARAEADAHGG